MSHTNLVRSILIFLSIVSCYTSARNPGVFALASKSVLERLKTNWWADVSGLIKEIKIGEIKPDISGITLKLDNLVLGQVVDEKNVKQNLGSGTSTVSLDITDITISGSSPFSASFQFLSTRGTIIVNGKISHLIVSADLKTTTKDNGQIPIINITSTSVTIGELNFDSRGSATASVVNFILKNIGPQKDFVSSKIQDALGNNASLQKSQSDAANKAITDFYPTTIPLKEFDLGISTYTTEPITFHPQSAEFPMEGFVYQLSKGYKANDTCIPMKEFLNPNDVSNDQSFVLADCTINSAIQSLYESQYQFPFSLNTTPNKILYVSQAPSIHQEINFIEGKQKGYLAIVIRFDIDKQPIIATANAGIEITLEKKGGLKLRESNVSYNGELAGQSKYQNKFYSLFTRLLKVRKVLDNNNKDDIRLEYAKSCGVNNFEEFRRAFPGVSADVIMATYKINVEIKKIENQKMTGIPEIWMELISKALVGNKIDPTVEIPQVCIENKLCIRSFDVLLKNGFIQGNANLEFKGGKEEEVEFGKKYIE